MYFLSENQALDYCLSYSDYRQRTYLRCYGDRSSPVVARYEPWLDFPFPQFLDHLRPHSGLMYLRKRSAEEIRSQIKLKPRQPAARKLSYFFAQLHCDQ
jgi:hypothetical protein